MALRVLTNTERDRKESEQRQQAERAEAERKQQEEASSSAVRTLRDPAQKESASWLVSASSVENAGDRAKLARALIEVLHMRQDAGSAAGFDMEEANSLLESTTKKMASLGKDEQEELYRRIKIKKRHAGAGVSRESERGHGQLLKWVCTLRTYQSPVRGVHRGHHHPPHTADHVDGPERLSRRRLPSDPLDPAASGRRQSGYAFSGYEPAPAAYYPPAPPVQQSFYAAPAAAAAAPAGPPQPWQGSTRGECYRCGKAGHVQAYCRAPEQEVACVPGSSCNESGTTTAQTGDARHSGSGGGRSEKHASDGECASASTGSSGRACAYACAFGPHVQGRP